MSKGSFKFTEHFLWSLGKISSLEKSGYWNMSHIYEQKWSKSTWLLECLQFIPLQYTYCLIERSVNIRHPGLSTAIVPEIVICYVWLPLLISFS